MSRVSEWWSRRCRNCAGWGYVAFAWPCPDCKGEGFYPKPKKTTNKEIEMATLFSIPKTGDRVQLIPKNADAPTIEGVVRESYDTYMHIQGLGFTQFQEHHYDVRVIEYAQVPEPVNIEAPAPEVSPTEAAKATLVKLLDSYDEGIRLGAAKELMNAEPWMVLTSLRPSDQVRRTLRGSRSREASTAGAPREVQR